jgi:hypothetical protein
MTDPIAFVTSPFGAALFKKAKFDLKKRGIPDTHSEQPALDEFVEAVSAITVPAAAANDVSAPDFLRARENFQAYLKFYLESLEPEEVDEAPEERSAGPARANTADWPSRPAGSSASFQVAGRVAGTANLRFAGGSAGPDDVPDAGPSQDDQPTKRPRLGMSDADLARACTVMDAPAARVTPQFLVDKPLDVRMYTPLLVDLYASVRKVNEGIASIAREVLQFEGDFLELSPTAVAALATTQLFATCDLEGGSRLLHRLESLHAAGANLRAKNLRCQRAFWLANHTPGCNWDTWEQLVHREDQDAGADLCNPCFVPLTSWDDQVKAAIIGARQEAVALSKDGKSLVGPILPRLLARHTGGGSRPEWRHRAASGDKGGGLQSTPRSNPTPPGRSAAFRRPKLGAAAPTGKENRNKNAASPAAPKASPAAKPAAKP